MTPIKATDAGDKHTAGVLPAPAVVAVDERSPKTSAVDDELLIVVPPARGEARAPWVREDFVQSAVPSLSRSQDYLTYHAGFLKDAGRAPYVVLDWQKDGANALERRWVAHKLLGGLGQVFNTRKVAVYLEKGARPAEVALAEDVLTRGAAALYQKSQLEGLRYLTPDPAGLKEVDPFQGPRLKGQLTFRKWVNENPDEMTSLELGSRLASFCKGHDCTFESLDVDRLRQLGMNLLLAVGQASDRSPSRLHLATHNVKPGAKPLLLVGKGITFDTGGIQLKAHESFVNCMKNDMGGAGLVANLFMALVESGYPGPLALAVPTCENLIDARSVKPGAVVRSYSGKDVFIEHTDAEGRLILADAISYAQKTFDPALTVVCATLTMASLRQFTNFFTAVHFADAKFQKALADAGAAWGEEFTFWGEFLPFLAGNKTQCADLTNMGRLPAHANVGGACNVAAHFVREFATKPLVHVDIFASTWNWSGDYPGAHYGATGAPFNSLFESLRKGPV